MIAIAVMISMSVNAAEVEEGLVLIAVESNTVRGGREWFLILSRGRTALHALDDFDQRQE